MTTKDPAQRNLPKLDAPADGDEKGWLSWRNVAFFLGLLALNYILASAFVNKRGSVAAALGAADLPPVVGNRAALWLMRLQDRAVRVGVAALNEAEVAVAIRLEHTDGRARVTAAVAIVAVRRGVTRPSASRRSRSPGDSAIRRRIGRRRARRSRPSSRERDLGRRDHARKPREHVPGTHRRVIVVKCGMAPRDAAP